MDSTKALKPCPFCGGTDIDVLPGSPDGFYIWHKCGWEGFASEMYGYRCTTEADAIEKWNRRPTLAAQGEAAQPAAEKSASDAPCWYNLIEAEAWASGYNAALAASPNAASQGEGAGE